MVQKRGFSNKSFVVVFQNAKLSFENNLKQIYLALFPSGFKEDPIFRKIPIIALVTLVLNLFYLSNFSVSIDDEILNLHAGAKLMVATGRYTTAFMNYLFFPRPVIPYFPFLFFSLCLAISYFFLIKAHGVKKSYQIYLTLPVFVSFPIWQFLVGFDVVLPALSVGVVCVSLACFLFERTRLMSVKKVYGPLAISIVIQSILLATALGAYQSFLLLYLAMCFGTILIKAIDKNGNETPQTIIHSIAQMALVAGLGLALYFSIGYFLRWVTHTKSDSYNELKLQFSNMGQSLLTFVTEAFAYYSGDPFKFGIRFFSIPALIILSIIFLFQRLWPEKISKKLSGVLLWLFVIATPFLLQLVSIRLPTRAHFTIAYVVWLLAILLMTAERKLIRSLNIVVILMLTWQSLYTDGLYNARSSFAQRYDSMLAADIFSRIGSSDPGFDRKQIVSIDVYGMINFDSVYPNPWSGSIGASFFDWDDGNLGRIVPYMKLLGYSNIQELTYEKRLALTPEFEKMPIWPAAGSVKRIDNVYLIRISKSPDIVHQQYKPTP